MKRGLLSLEWLLSRPKRLAKPAQFCGAKGGAAQVVSTEESKPPFLLGNFPWTEIQFRLRHAAEVMDLAVVADRPIVMYM